MKNYFKWIMLFLYLVVIGAVVNYYTGKYEKEKREEQMDKKVEIDSLIEESIMEDSLNHQEIEQVEGIIEGGR